MWEALQTYKKSLIPEYCWLVPSKKVCFSSTYTKSQPFLFAPNQQCVVVYTVFARSEVKKLRMQTLVWFWETFIPRITVTNNVCLKELHTPCTNEYATPLTDVLVLHKIGEV